MRTVEGPKISVIVPVYKVEPYLHKCLDSIVNQTYRNLEIILVDDGSPDNCGAVCDEYAAGDRRIKVIHQKNGGLSAARNAGLKIVSGDYLGFVDSDDWVEPEMFETLLRGIQTAGADIAICGRWEEYSGHRIPYSWPEVRSLGREEALEELLRNDRVQNLVWDKLYRQELFEGIWFPEGKTFEDIAVMHRLFLRSEKMVCTPGTMYHYLQRPGSIVADISLKNRVTHYEMVWARYNALREDWPQFAGLMEAQCVISAIGIWTSYLSNPREEREKYAAEIRRIADFSARHYRDALNYVNLGLAGRIVLRLVPYDTWWSFTLANFIGKLYQRKHNRTL